MSIASACGRPIRPLLRKKEAPTKVAGTMEEKLEILSAPVELQKDLDNYCGDFERGFQCGFNQAIELLQCEINNRRTRAGV